MADYQQLPLVTGPLSTFIMQEKKHRAHLKSGPPPTPRGIHHHNAGGEATKQVLCIPELLEMILLEVTDERAVLLAQRVSTMFRNLILTSPRIRHKLFLPSPLPRNSDTLERPRVNPIIMRCFAVKSTRQNPKNDEFPKLPRKRGVISGAQAEFQPFEVFENCAGSFCVFIRHNFFKHQHESASWRDMHLSDPPCHVWVRGSAKRGYRYPEMLLGEVAEEWMKDRHDCDERRYLPAYMK